MDGIPRNIGFCSHTIQGEGPFVIADTWNDERFASNPLVQSDEGIRFYAGAPLVSPEGLPVGTLCIMDHAPRPALNSAERTLLTDLAALAVSYMARSRSESSEVRGG